MSTKVIFRRAEVFVLAEVCLPSRPHAVFSRSQVLSEERKWRRMWKANEYLFLSKIRPRLACMRTSRNTDFRWNKDFRSSKNNFRRHDISQGLDREPPFLSPHFLLAHTVKDRELKTLTRVGIEPTTHDISATRPTFAKRNPSLYLYMFIALTLTSSVPTAAPV